MKIENLPTLNRTDSVVLSRKQIEHLIIAAREQGFLLAAVLIRHGDLT